MNRRGVGDRDEPPVFKGRGKEEGRRGGKDWTATSLKPPAAKERRR